MIFFFLSFFLTLPVSAGAVSESDFKADTTEQIVNLCTANAEEPLYHQAVNFCHGYLVGSFDYYEADHAGHIAKEDAKEISGLEDREFEMAYARASDITEKFTQKLK